MPREEEVLAFVQEFMAEYRLQPCGPNSAFGEIKGHPLTMTVLGDDPFSLLFAFRIVQPESGQFEPPILIREMMAEGDAKVSIEDGLVWLSLYRLDGVSREMVQGVVETFADGLTAAQLALPPGCATAGCEGTAGPVHIEGRTSRLCPACVERLFAEREQAERELNRMSTKHMLGLPLVFLLVAGGWGLFWLLVDLVLSWLKVNVIILDKFTIMLFLGILGVFGYSLGVPLGTFLRRSGMVSMFPAFISVVALLMVAVVGEYFYINAYMFRTAKVIDLGLALQWLPQWIWEYPGWWLAGKLIAVAAVAAGMLTTNERQRAALRV